MSTAPRITEPVTRGRAEPTSVGGDATDGALAGVTDPAAADGRHGRTARGNLLELVGEYARHDSPADLVRQAGDGATGG